MRATIPSFTSNKGTVVSAIPKTMRAAILVRQREPLVVGEVELPRELLHGQVLVRVRYSGICGSQLGEIDGVKGEYPHLPHLLGHEGSGTVLAVGGGVRTVAPGADVVLHWMAGQGLRSDPPAYQWQGRKLNAGFVTTFNEYAVVSENRVTPVPPGVGLDLAALFGCAVTTGFGVIDNKAEVKLGQSVAVLGAGGVGLSMIQGAALAGAWPIVAVDRYANRLDLAQAMGATHCVNAAACDMEPALRAIFGPAGADVVIDNTGVPAVIQAAYRLLGAKGRLILVGVPAKGAEVSLHTLPLHFGKQITGTKGGECAPDLDIPRYGRLCAAGRLDLSGLITERFGLGEINTAIARMRDGSMAGRCLIEFQHP